MIVSSHVSAEQMSGDDEGDDHSDGCNKQLPRPEVALKKERHCREQRCDDATDGLRTEVQDNACHETAHAAEQTEISEETLLEHSRKACCKTSKARGKADKYPHL